MTSFVLVFIGPVTLCLIILAVCIVRGAIKHKREKRARWKHYLERKWGVHD